MTMWMTYAKLSLTIDNDNVHKGWKHVHRSKMWQPFSWFSMTLQTWKIWILNPQTLLFLYTPCSVHATTRCWSLWSQTASTGVPYTEAQTCWVLLYNARQGAEQQGMTILFHTLTIAFNVWNISS